MLYSVRRNDPPQMTANEKPRAVAVRQDDESPCLPIEAQQGFQLPILENAESSCFKNDAVDDLQKTVLIIPPLHHQGLPQSGLHASATMVTKRLRSRSSGSA